MTKGKDTLLELRNWSLVRDTPAGPITLLRDIDLDIQCGECIGILGANGIVGGGIAESKSLRHRKVQLDRPQLPRPVQAVANVEINLRSVKRPVAFVDLIIHLLLLERTLECIRRCFPDLVGTDMLFGLGG